MHACWHHLTVMLLRLENGGGEGGGRGKGERWGWGGKIASYHRDEHCGFPKPSHHALGGLEPEDSRVGATAAGEKRKVKGQLWGETRSLLVLLKKTKQANKKAQFPHGFTPFQPNTPDLHAHIRGLNSSHTKFVSLFEDHRQNAVLFLLWIVTSKEANQLYFYQTFSAISLVSVPSHSWREECVVAVNLRTAVAAVVRSAAFRSQTPATAVAYLCVL